MRGPAPRDVGRASSGSVRLPTVRAFPPTPPPVRPPLSRNASRSSRTSQASHLSGGPPCPARCAPGKGQPAPAVAAAVHAGADANAADGGQNESAADGGAHAAPGPAADRSGRRRAFARTGAGDEASGGQRLTLPLAQAAPPPTLALARLSQLARLLYHPDASQRPWGVSPEASDEARLALQTPHEVGHSATLGVRATTVEALGVGLGPGAAVPVLSLFEMLDAGALALAAALAVGLAPRGSAMRYRAAHVAAWAGADALPTLVAARRSWLRRALVALGLDARLAWPAPVGHDASGHTHVDVAPPVRAIQVQRANVVEWGAGLGFSVWLPGLSVRRSLLRHTHRGSTLTVRRVGPSTHALALELLRGSWRAWLTEGFLWGTEHRGEGEQVRAHYAWTGAPDDPRTWCMAAAFADAAARDAPVLGGRVAPTAQRLERATSGGAGWRWPFWLPFGLTAGAGRLRQRTTSYAGALPVGGRRTALELLGLDEDLRLGRVSWSSRLTWPPAADPESATGPAAATPDAWPELRLTVQVPVSTPARRHALLQALGLRGEQERAGPDAAGVRRGLQLQVAGRVPMVALLQLAPGANVTPHAMRTATDEAAWAAMEAHGLKLPEVLRAQGAGTQTLRLRVAYAQTQALHQDAALHLAAWPTRHRAAPRGWCRRARTLVRQLAAERHALQRCPTFALQPTAHASRVRRELGELGAHLRRRLRAASAPGAAAVSRDPVGGWLLPPTCAPPQLTPAGAEAPLPAPLRHWVVYPVDEVLTQPNWLRRKLARRRAAAEAQRLGRMQAQAPAPTATPQPVALGPPTTSGAAPAPAEASPASLDAPFEPFPFSL